MKLVTVQRRPMRVVALLVATLPASMALGLGPSQDRANAHTSGSEWVDAWGASPQEPPTDGPFDGGQDTSPQFVNQSIRNIVNTHRGGEVVRVRLSNEFGDRPVTFRNVFIGLEDEPGQPNTDAADQLDDASIVPGSNRRLTFNGNNAVTIEPGRSVNSDSARLRVESFQDLAISFFLPNLTGPATQHSSAMQTNFVALGNQSSDETGIPYVPSGQSWFFLTDVDVRAGAEAGTVVAFGDSITDGLESTPDVNNRYPDFLAQRLQNDYRFDHLSTENQGIAGNRVLRDNIGPSALNRLDSDVLSQPGVTDVILAAGINDLANPPFIGTPDQNADAEDVIAGLKEIIRRTHAQGICIYGGTLTPPGNLLDPARPPFTTYSTPEVNAEREKVNRFIRTTALFDGVFDFDRAVRDPANPQALQDRFANVDNFHPNDAGYQRLAQEVDLSLVASSTVCS